MKDMTIEYKGKTYIACPYVDSDTGILRALFYESTPQRIIFKKRYIGARTVWVEHDKTVKESITEEFYNVIASVEADEEFYKKIEEYEKTT